MGWLTWRQHRASLTGGLAVLAALAVVMAVTGNRMRSQFIELGLDRCELPVTYSGDSCGLAVHLFQQANSGFGSIVTVAIAVPALLGLFWGAPLVARELEQGTHRLAWTQSVSRLRWLVVKAGVLVAVTAALVGAATALLAWWIEPMLQTRPSPASSSRLAYPLFDMLGVAPAVYAVTALAVGVAAGTLVRRSVVALGLTLLIVVGLRVGVGNLRHLYQEPVAESGPLALVSDVGSEPRGMVLSRETRTADGRVIGAGSLDPDRIAELCPEGARALAGPPIPGSVGAVPVGPGDIEALRACAREHGFHVVTRYHPEDRFWRFQLTEAAIYLVVSGAALRVSAWWIRRRLA